MAGKNKISKVKRNNQTKSKLQKQGKIKSQRNKRKPQKQIHQQQEQTYSDEESDQSDGVMDMLDQDDLEYMQEFAKTPKNGFLNSVPLESEETKPKDKRKRKRKISERTEDELEEKYEDMSSSRKSKKKSKSLLPIKTKEGIVTRTQEVDASDEESELESDPENKDEQENRDATNDQLEDENVETLSAADLLIARQEELQDKRFRIGTLSSGLLESPDQKMKNFFPLFSFMDKKKKDGDENLISVRKLATLSIYEVFKDILPEYQIKHQDFSQTKLKKDTLSLYRFESELLAHFKRYLKRLEKAANVLRQKRGQNHKIDDPIIKLGQISLSCLCGLLAARPYFNYATNICQTIIPFLDNKHPTVRKAVSDCCKTIFDEDKKGEVSLEVVRRINNLVKTRSNNVHCEAVTCLLSLRIKDVNLDAEKKLEVKQKKESAKKSRLVNMSKKEKKRNKRLHEVEQDMLETKAEENKLTKQKHLTEITKTVFMIYFRILKKSPHSKLLSATLEGLSKFAHIINLEYYSDLVNILSFLLANDVVAYRERLHCIQTVFSILSGRGDALNIDPTKFYAYFYSNLLNIHAGRTHEDVLIIIDTMISILLKRRRKISQQILLAYVKRLATLALQVQHNGALACLSILKSVMQQSKVPVQLLELEDGVGSGRYDGELLEPEHCCANASALYELPRLALHYHPAVRKYATHVAAAAPSSGEHSLNIDISKLSAEELYDQYDGSKMAFKPAIPVPKKAQEKKKVSSTHTFVISSLEDYCMERFNGIQENGVLDWHREIKKNK